MALRLALSLTLLISLTEPAFAQTSPCGTIEFQGPDSLSVCLGDVIQPTVNLDVTGTLSVQPAADFLDGTSNLERPRIRPSASGFYKITVTQPGVCAIADSIYIDVDRLVVPELIDDTTVCQGQPFALLAEPIADAGNSNYRLFAGEVLIDRGRDPNFEVTVDTATVFTLRATSDNGECEEERTVSVDIIPGRFDIPLDTIFACLGGDSVVLSVATQGLDDLSDIRWSPRRFNAAPAQGNRFTVAPTANITYFAEATINGCARIDSVAVRLDSLPDNLSMELDPEKDPYCQGDTFFVRSPVYDAGDFPLIIHDWTDAPGLQSPRELYNGVFIAQDTATLQRVTTNGACRDTQEILVNVVEPPQVSFEPTDPVCPGVEVQITATFDTGSGTLEWTDPGNTLSCTDCLDPVATVQQTTTYEITLEAEGSECTSDLSYTLNVEPGAVPTLTQETLICPGDSRQLIVAGFDPQTTYRITGGGIDSNDPRVLVSPTETTTYSIETDGRCGPNTQTVEIVVLDEYDVTLDAATTVCAGEPLNLSAAVEPELEGTYLLTLPNGTSLAGPDATVQDPESGTYTVTFRDALGCTSATDEIEVEVLGQNIDPRIVATLADGTTVQPGGAVFAGNDVTLTVTNVPGDLTFDYSWTGNYDPNSGSGEVLTVSIPRTPDGQDPDPLVYTVTLTSEEGGCTFTADIVLPVEQSQVVAPDFFTPDNDGRNDRFRLFFNGVITDYTMIVYNRWGQKVWTSEDPLEGWDGTKGGSPQNSDVYLYLAKFRQDGAEVTQEGQFSLLR